MSEFLIYDENDNTVREGEIVRVNSEHEGRIHITGEGEFTVEGWPEDAVIESIELVRELQIDTANIHPTIKE